MNPHHALTTRGASSARTRTLGLDRPTGPLNFATGAVITLSAETTIPGLGLGGKCSRCFYPPPTTNTSEPGRTAVTVTESDPFIRYHGDYYHAHGCAETHGYEGARVPSRPSFTARREFGEDRVPNRIRR
jgi:hypothetical protein